MLLTFIITYILAMAVTMGFLLEDPQAREGSKILIALGVLLWPIVSLMILTINVFGLIEWISKDLRKS